jgi:predicted porin
MKKILMLMVGLSLALYAPASAAEFADLPINHWAYSAVAELSKAGIVQGYPNGTFSGQRSISRYEMASIIQRTIPVLQEAVKASLPAPVKPKPGPQGPRGQQGVAGPRGAAGPRGPQGPRARELDTIIALVNGFKPELTALGANIPAIQKDIAALQQRVAAVEAEQARVKFNGEVTFIGRAEVNNSGEDSLGIGLLALDRDGRAMVNDVNSTNPGNLFSNVTGFTDFQLSIKGKVSDTLSATALIDAGNYLPFALNSAGAFAVSRTDRFTLWNAYADAALNLPLVGKTGLTVGRFPFQLTPYTMKFIDPDSYAYLPILDNGDFVVDGMNAQMNIGSIAFNAFAAKSNVGNSNGATALNLINPAIPLGGMGYSDLGAFFGGRAVIGIPFNGNLGLTYLNTQVADIANAQTQIYGADLNLTVAGIGISGEWDKSDPNAALTDAVTAPDGSSYAEKNSAWNGKLSYQTGNLGLAAGYTVVEANYTAPGSWNRLGIWINPTNIKGIVGNVTYAFAPGLSFVGDVQFLQPNDTGSPVTFRQPADKFQVATLPNEIDKINYWKAGVKYALTSSDSVDLGYEQVEITPVDTANVNQVQRYVTLGVGHTFSPGASLKVLYQITELTSADTLRGGVASAQIQFKY